VVWPDAWKHPLDLAIVGADPALPARKPAGRAKNGWPSRNALRNSDAQWNNVSTRSSPDLFAGTAVAQEGELPRRYVTAQRLTLAVVG
jgi:hypothetical protein